MSWFGRILGKLTNPKSKYVTPGLEEKLKPSAPPTDSDEQKMRRRESEIRLRGEGIPLNSDLPDVPAASDVSLRSSREVADRALALTLVGMKAHGMDHEVMLEIVRERAAENCFTADEHAFIMTPAPAPADLERFASSFEAAWALIWALRLVREPLSTPRDVCNFDRLIEIVRDTPDLSIYDLRRPCRILDKLDLFLRYDWAVKQAARNGIKPPSHLNPAVAMERYHALSWLTCQIDYENWEDDALAA